MPKNRVFVNNYCSLCAAGDNSQELFESICQGKSGIQTNSSFFEGKSVGLGVVKDDLYDHLLQKIQTILKNSNLENFEETLLVIGSSVGGMKRSEEIYLKENSYKNITPALHTIDAISYTINKKYKFKDDISFSTACTSSANALGYAYEVISKGIYRNVLVVGFDTLCKITVGGFSSLGVLSQFPCKPFDKQRDGMNVAEALALLLLQDEKKQESVEMYGVGYSCDAHHMTQPNPQGLGAISAMQKALTWCELKKEEIDYINAHGTGTLANDSSELNAIKTLFGNSVQVSSTKSITGHTLGAAGALEAIISIMVLQKQIVVPNHLLSESEIDGINYVFKAEQKKINYVLSNSFAFGGNNTSLCFGLAR
jgi:3-oxoacyl-[acyl-carrier-protein] synthase-1